MLKPKQFQNQVAIVTGAASGIGFGLSQLLWEQGAQVIMSDINEESLEQAALKISNLKERVTFHVANVANEEDVQTLIQSTYESFGKIDLLFNNAGIGLAGDMKDFTPADWKKNIEVNLWGVIYGIHAVYPLMIEQGFGHIINTASGAGLTPKPGMTPYSAIKHAIVGLSTSLRAEAIDYGVNVSVVCPGYIATNIMNTSQYKNIDSEKLKAKLSKVPIKPTSPAKCAEVVLKGILKNKAIITVTALAAIDWWLYRMWPNASIKLNHLRGVQLRKTRTSE